MDRQRNDSPYGPGVHGDEQHLVLYSTWVGLLATSLVPPGLLILGWTALSVRGSSGLGWGMITAAVFIGLWAGRDFPRHVVIGPEGIVRRCLLRTHHLDYGEVAVIQRAPAARLATARALQRQPLPEHRPVLSGLLAAGPGRRRWMLTDQPESREEFDRLAALLVVNTTTDLRASRPQPGAPPTSLYRRRTPVLP